MVEVGCFVCDKWCHAFYGVKITDEPVLRMRGWLRLDETLSGQHLSVDLPPCSAVTLILDQHGHIVAATQACCELLGYHQKQLLGMCMMQLDIIHSQQQLQDYLTSVCQGERLQIQSRYRQGDGSAVDVIISLERMLGKDPACRISMQLQPVVIAAEPCSAYRWPQQYDLNADEQQLLLLESAIAAINEAIMITDKAGTIVYVNPAFSRTTGYAAEAVLGRSPAILNSGQHSQQLYQQLWRTLQQGKPWTGRILNRKKDGTIFPNNLSVAPIFDMQGAIQHYVAVYEDLTDSENMQKQIIKAQKMEAVAVMVGGIAHDFNNMLAGMVGNFYLMRQHYPDDQILQQRIRSMEASTHHGANMIRQMLTFARKDITDMQVLRLDQLVKESHRLTAAMVPEDIRFELAIEQTALYVRADATQLQQVLLNLVANARHAIQSRYKQAASPHAGQIRLTLSAAEPPSHLLREHPEMITEHGWCCVRCEDNGCGIKAADMEHVFDPFFTTKPTGEGTGLGMAMVYGAVQNHRGLIDIESELNQGTRVSIWLPKHADAVPVRDARVDIELDGRGRCLLLVDDEQALRTVLKEVLEQKGFRVLLAADGEQAVDVFRTQMADIDAVLMDVVMPNKGGLLAAKEIRQCRADVPIIFQTSYGEQAQHSVFDSMPCCTSLQKPVHIPALFQAIQSSLHGREDGSTTEVENKSC